MLLSGFSCISALTSICLAQITTPPTVEIVTDQSGNDLTSYVSRPDIRAPRYNVTKHVPDQIASGYWFVAPYTRMGSIPNRHEYLPRQVGPHIYDGNGELVWSGASIDENLNVFDFRVYQSGNKSQISYILNPDRANSASKSAYVLMDDTYNKTTTIPSYHDWGANEHEFQVFDDGRKALLLTYRFKLFNVTNSTGSVVEKKLQDNCLLEIDTASAAVDFEWCPLDRGITPDDSAGSYDGDFLHANSIDRFRNGDLIFSARHASTVFKISRSNGSIAWRLGGKNSDFVMDFNFTAQHHVKIISENASMTVLTLLDNASEGRFRQKDSAMASSAMMIALHTSERPYQAKLLQQWVRPDGKLTTFRGNVQTLPNGNRFTGWSAEGYVSEFTSDGTLLLEAKWESPRFGTYRAYKFPFVGKPSEPPTVKTLQHKADQSAVTVAYVSWNGATEVASWRFMGVSDGAWAEMGTLARTGFETVLTIAGVWDNVTATALDASGQILGASASFDVPTINGTGSVTSTAKTDEPFHPVSALVQQASITLSRSSAWVLIVSAVLLTLVAQCLVFAAYCLYRRIEQRRSWLSGKVVEGESDEPLLETRVGKI